MVYSRDIRGKELVFGHSGRVLRNALVVYDSDSNSLWSQFVGEAVQGPYTGTKLELIPSMMTTWAKWKEEYPDTLALQTKEVSMMQKMMQTFNASYYTNSSAGMQGEFVEDDRLSDKELVIGYADDQNSKAYQLSKIAREKIINDQIGDVPVTVFYHSGTSSSKLFDRFIMGEELTFKSKGFIEDIEVAVDDQTGSTWNTLNGQCINGTLEGAYLQPLPSHLSYWFAWTDHYPSTFLY
tara:strand:- start:12352 stop:13065 length:714 start_codon:yes stop_codon:yes gene_type:complete